MHAWMAASSSTTQLCKVCGRITNTSRTPLPQYTRRFRADHIPRAQPDLDWEPDVRKKVPLTAPSQYPPPPPRPPSAPGTAGSDDGAYFKTRRDAVLAVVGGGALYWLALNKVFLNISEEPPSDTPFKVFGAKDVRKEDFVYYKTPGGHWVAVAEDEVGRHYMIDEVGDLYYDSGDPQVGVYVMDRQGDLFNWYIDTDGKRKITPVGNIKDLKSMYVDSIADLKLDRSVKVVGFQDEREVPLPPNAGFYSEDGKFNAPGELLEGFMSQPDDLVTKVLRPEAANEFRGVRPELELDSKSPFSEQLMQQVMKSGQYQIQQVGEEEDDNALQMALP